MRYDHGVLELTAILQASGCVVKNDDQKRVLAVHGTNNVAIKHDGATWHLVIDGHPEPVGKLGEEGQVADAALRVLNLDLPARY